MWLIALAALGIAVAVVCVWMVGKSSKVEDVWRPVDAAEASLPRRGRGKKSVDLGAEPSATKSEWELTSESRTQENNAANAKPTRELWSEGDYCWVVICKNRWFHRQPNVFNVHRIPLGETDAVTSRPPVHYPFAACCDECGKEYTYKPSEVLRYQLELPPAFVPHPLFKD